jgi:hypothetical protein
MAECRHCGESVAGDEEYAEHLQEEHSEDELSALDRRRVEQHAPDTDDDSIGLLPIAVVVLLAAILAVVAFRALDDGGSSVDAGVTPEALYSVHYHGGIEVTITGDRVDFSQSQYQRRADAFHFEGGDGSRWHVHARSVTLEYAMATLGFDVTESSVAVGGETYRDTDPAYAVSVTVNGETVRPGTYVLERNDIIRINVSRAT